MHDACSSRFAQIVTTAKELCYISVFLVSLRIETFVYSTLLLLLSTPGPGKIKKPTALPPPPIVFGSFNNAALYPCTNAGCKLSEQTWILRQQRFHSKMLKVQSHSSKLISSRSAWRGSIFI